MTSPSRERALSITELLVIISILIVLAAILVPIFGSIRQNGQSTACMARMRQLGAIVLHYSADHNFRLLPAASGANALMNDRLWYYDLDDEGFLPGSPIKPINQGKVSWFKNRESIMACPSRPNPPCGYWPGVNTSHDLHYALNQNPGFLNRVNTSGGRWPRLQDIANPGRTFMLAEANGPVGQPNGSGFVYPHPSRREDSHSGRGMNVVFFDGHAEYFRGRFPNLGNVNYSNVPYANIPPEQSFPYF